MTGGGAVTPETDGHSAPTNKAESMGEVEEEMGSSRDHAHTASDGQGNPTLADILAEPFEPGRTYMINTISELIEVCRILPEDRREVMLAEMLTGVRLAAAHFNLLAALGIERSGANEPISWVDDGEGEIAVNTRFADGTPAVSLLAQRDTPIPCDREGNGTERPVIDGESSRDDPCSSPPKGSDHE